MEAPPTPTRAGPSQEQPPKAGLCPKCRRVSEVAPVQPLPPRAASHHPQLPAAGEPLGFAGAGGRRGFLNSCSQAKPRGKPLAGPCLSQASTAKNMSCSFGTECREVEPPAQPPPAPWATNTPKSSPEGFMGLMQASRSCSLCLGFFCMAGFFWGVR